jgi:Spy/CpxP family protein refolding chaperone
MRKTGHLMRDHIKAFLLTSSLAFGIPTLALMRAETISRVAAILTPEQREKLRGRRAS